MNFYNISESHQRITVFAPHYLYYHFKLDNFLDNELSETLLGDCIHDLHHDQNH